MNTKIEFTREACERATEPQMRAIARLCGERIERVVVASGLFDLPDGYLTFRQQPTSDTGSTSIYGGISPEGHVST